MGDAPLLSAAPGSAVPAVPVSFAGLRHALDSTAREGALLLSSWEVRREESGVDSLNGDLSALVGSILKVKSPALAAGYGEWLCIMPDAEFSATGIQVRTFSSIVGEVQHASRLLMVDVSILDDLVGSWAPGDVTPATARREDPNFGTHLTQTCRPCFTAPAAIRAVSSYLQG